MRGGVSALHVLTAVCGLGKMVGPAEANDPEQWRRLVRVLLDGLRQPPVHHTRLSDLTLHFEKAVLAALSVLEAAQAVRRRHLHDGRQR
jgi:hypothetical protein